MALAGAVPSVLGAVPARRGDLRRRLNRRFAARSRQGGAGLAQIQFEKLRRGLNGRFAARASQSRIEVDLKVSAPQHLRRRFYGGLTARTRQGGLGVYGTGHSCRYLPIIEIELRRSRYVTPLFESDEKKNVPENRRSQGRPRALSSFSSLADQLLCSP